MLSSYDVGYRSPKVDVLFDVDIYISIYMDPAVMGPSYGNPMVDLLLGSAQLSGDSKCACLGHSEMILQGLCIITQATWPHIPSTLKWHL